jgi:hypothetical protein
MSEQKPDAAPRATLETSFAGATIEERTGIFVMPLTGGVPQRIGVVGRGVEAPTLDASYVYMRAGGVLLRIELIRAALAM